MRSAVPPIKNVQQPEACPSVQHCVKSGAQRRVLWISALDLSETLVIQSLPLVFVFGHCRRNADRLFVPGD